MPAQDTCAYGSVNSISKVEDKETLPMHNVWHRLRHHACMESKESSEGGDANAIGDYTRQIMSEDKTRMDKEAHTTSKHLEGLRHVLVHQDISQGIPGSISQVLGDQSKLWEASMQLTKEAKRHDLDVIVRACVAAIIGLLNIHTDKNSKYSWMEASEVVAKMQGHGMTHAQCICKWAIGFLKWGDLPFHQLNRKQGTIIDDKDVAEEIKTCMAEKAGGSFLKAQDIVEIVASPKMQEIFALKGISKPSISIKTALRWLEKLGWTYGKLKNGMHLDGHERLDVVEYRQGFVEHWMRHEQ